MDAFLAKADAVKGRLQVEGSVDDAASELACLGLGDDLQIVDGIRKDLGADFLGTMDQRDTRLLDAEGVADVVHIVYLLTALGVGRHRYDSGIGEEEQLLILRNLSHRDMCQYMSRAQYARLTIEDGPQDDIGVDEALHQDVSLATLTERHCATGTLFLVVAIDIDGLDESHLLSFLNCITGAGIVGTHHSHALLVAPLLQEDNHVVQISYRLHNVTC